MGKVLKTIKQQLAHQNTPKFRYVSNTNCVKMYHTSCTDLRESSKTKTSCVTHWALKPSGPLWQLGQDNRTVCSVWKTLGKHMCVKGKTLCKYLWTQKTAENCLSRRRKHKWVEVPLILPPCLTHVWCVINSVETTVAAMRKHKEVITRTQTNNAGGRNSPSALTAKGYLKQRFNSLMVWK